MTTSSDLRERLTRVVFEINAVDTHEHIPNEQVALEREWSFFDFFDHYVSSDLVSAGMPRNDLERMRDTRNGLSLEARWQLMAPYWPHAATTGYGTAMREYMRDLFGVPDINGDTVLELCARIREAHKPGWYRTVLKDRANFATSIVITWPGQPVTVEREHFRAVPILDHYANVSTRDELHTLEAESGHSIQTFDQLLAALESKLGQFVGEGIVAVKIFQAYSRTLQFDRVERATAARVFDRVWLSKPLDLSFADLKPMQDYVMRHIIGLATDRGLPIQIHTGLQEGNGNVIENSRPTHLANLFLDFGDTRWDVFHAGYPWTSHTATLAKNFQNVYVNLCWTHAISPRMAARTLHEWLETVPSNKIFAIGGDSNYVEGGYGHGKIARRICAQVLAEKVEEGYFSEEEALAVAQKVMRDNALDFYRLDELRDA